MTDGTAGIDRRKFLAGTAAAAGAAGAWSLAGPAGSAAAEEPAAAAAAPFGPVVVTPAQQQYAELVHGVNRRYVSRPESVFLVDSAEQVADVLRRAVRAGKRVTVRSGGHCLEDFVDNPDV